MESVKLHFELEIDEYGWPPVSVETLNALQISGTSVELDNTPFFAENVALGDIIECEPMETKGHFRFGRVTTESGNKALSIILFDGSAKEALCQYLESHGCWYEYGEFGAINMLAVSVLARAEYEPIKSHLDTLEASGSISYAELAI